MTSGAALGETTSVRNCENNPESGYCSQETCISTEEDGGDMGQYDSEGSDESNTPIFRGQKRQAPTISTSIPKPKKIRTSVQRTHSPNFPKTSLPVMSLTAMNRVQKVTPTIKGIEEVASHLIGSQSSSGGSHSIVALPTECTYEACSLLAWGKNDSASDEQSKLREEQLDKCELCSVASWYIACAFLLTQMWMVPYLLNSKSCGFDFISSCLPTAPQSQADGPSS